MKIACECVVRCQNCAAMVDDTTNFFYAVEILMQLEQVLGISIPDETVEAIRPWSELTLEDLVAATMRSQRQQDATWAYQVVCAAVRQEFPNTPETLDFTVPLRDALQTQGVG